MEDVGLRTVATDTTALPAPRFGPALAPPPGSPDARRGSVLLRIPTFLLHLALAISVADAQAPASLSAAGARAAELRPGTWTYDIVARVDGEEQKIGTRALVIEQATLDGRPAWLIAESSWTSGASMSDSLFVDRATLRPLRRALHMGGARLVADFDADSARGSIRTSSGASSPFAAAVPKGSVISSGMLEVLLRLSPLASEWFARADLVVIGSAGRTHTNTTTLRVTGAEAVSVPAGRFDAWTVSSTTADGRAQRLWLSRDGGWVVRSVAEIPDLPGAVVETVLVGQATAPPR